MSENLGSKMTRGDVQDWSNLEQISAKLLERLKTAEEEIEHLRFDIDLLRSRLKAERIDAKGYPYFDGEDEPPYTDGMMKRNVKHE